MKKVKKKTGSSKARSKRDLIKEQRLRLKSGSGKSNFIFLKADATQRLRNITTGEHDTPGLEVDQFYLGPELKGVISPHSIGLPCALWDFYVKCNSSDEDDDREIASSMGLRQRIVMPVYGFKDPKGKTPDLEGGAKLLLITPSLYEDWLEWYFDDEKGDPSDPKSGYDVKWKREGSGKMDTKYSIIDCKPTKAHPNFSKPIDLEKLLKESLPSYEETKTILSKFLGDMGDEEDEKSEKDTLLEKSKRRKGKSAKSKKRFKR